jgi:hypothetical protein
MEFMLWEELIGNKVPQESRDTISFDKFIICIIKIIIIIL